MISIKSTNHMIHKLIFCLCISLITIPLLSKGGETMEITSKDFKHNQSIPSIHTCDGKDLSPQLASAEIIGLYKRKR